MATFGSTEISSEFVHIKVGGDLALLKGMMKVMFEREAAGEPVLDHGFIAEHTSDFAALTADTEVHAWPDLVAVLGIDEAPIRRCAEISFLSVEQTLC